jgi:uncharacterized SAM-binding protein YcdF (DUF218 family)
MNTEINTGINPENKIPGRRKTLLILKAAGALTALGIILPPVLHFENTVRIIGTLSGAEVDCIGGVQPQDSKYKADAIVVPGAGIVREKDGTLEPNEYGRIRLEAAAIAFFNKEAPLIILLDGKTGSDDEQPAPVKYLQKMYTALNNGKDLIPEDALIVENKSVNTATNMQELTKIAEQKSIQLVLVVTNDFHRDRATLLACANGLAAVSVSAEDTVIANSPERKTEVEKIRKRGDDENRKEIPEVISQLWSPKGRLQIIIWGAAN